MLLTIDIGNTNITIGLYEGQSLGPRWRLATNHDRMPDEFGLDLLGLLSHQKIPFTLINNVIIASVVPQLTGKFKEACQKYLNCDPLIVDAGVRTGIRIRYDDPKAVGADRVVDAVAAHQLYGGPACIVDFGTATTFDAISGEGDYLGGAIAPGISVAADALFLRTAKLPRVDFSKPPSVIGKNTAHSLQSGLFNGYIALVEGMVERFRRELGAQMKVIATGGLAELLAPETTAIQIVAPWLTLEGLRLIHEMNRVHQPVLKSNKTRTAALA
ncbi:MAG: type III pantothenate kinase [Elusimicrobiota bacterium]